MIKSKWQHLFLKSITLNLTEKLSKFAATDASIFMDKIETNFLDSHEFKALVWF